MKLAQYLKDEKIIGLADETGIIERWRWGRRLVCDDEKWTETGQRRLRDGVRSRLRKQAEDAGMALSESEINYRIQCANAYPKKSMVLSAAGHHGSWRALCDAAFPAFSSDNSEPDYDPRSERTRQRPKPDNPLPEQHRPRELFPPEKFGPASTIGELSAYAQEMRELTERFAARDEARDRYLSTLRAKAGVTDDTAWADAEELDLWGSA